MTELAATIGSNSEPKLLLENIKNILVRGDETTTPVLLQLHAKKH